MRIMKNLISSLIVSGTIMVVTIMLCLGVTAYADPDTGCSEEISRGMEVSNPELELSEMAGITPKGAYLKIFASLSVGDTTRLWSDIVWLKDNTELRDVTVFINSGGGSAFDGIALANWISYAQDHWGFTFHGQASGIIASAAIPVFASMRTRMAMPGTIFMVHEAALWKWPGRETTSDIRAQGELMTLLRDTYLNILVANTKLTFEEWGDKEGRTTWFSVKEATEWGLITETGEDYYGE